MKGSTGIPRTLSDAIATTKELHSQYSSTKKWRGTTPHSDPLTKPIVTGLTSRLLSPTTNSNTNSNTNGNSITNPHDVLLLILPMPVLSAETNLDSWFHIQWDITAPITVDITVDTPMNGTEAEIKTKSESESDSDTTTDTSLNTTATAIATATVITTPPPPVKTTRSYGCGVVSFQWGSRTPITPVTPNPDPAANPNADITADTDPNPIHDTTEVYKEVEGGLLSINNTDTNIGIDTDSHTHPITIAITTADTPVLKVNLDGVLDKKSEFFHCTPGSCRVRGRWSGWCIGSCPSDSGRFQYYCY